MRVEPLGKIAPIDAFKAIRGLEQPFLFEGGGGGGSDVGGWYTYAGAEPSLIIKTDVAGTTVTVRYGAPPSPSIASPDKARGQDPFETLSEILGSSRPGVQGPFPFNGGVVGYFAYDLKDRLFEGRNSSERREKGLGLPECVLGIYPTVYVYDHMKKEGFLVSQETVTEQYKRIKGLVSSPRPDKAASADAALPGPLYAMRSNVTRPQYMDSIKRAKEYISAGDIYQINISQRLELPFPHGDGLTLYDRLAAANPTPFGSFMDFGSFQLISNTPERLLKVKGRVMETSPIKGTRPRGKTPAEDQSLVEELKASPKERAEHVMIVDLERNDLGKVSVTGSVEVVEFEKIETFTHLHHMVSTVRATVREGLDSVECLKAAFPGGSVTGAPKIRAMEIIDELETVPRGVYTGGIGWVDFSGDMDFSMAIRTAVYKEGVVYLHVGGGIVADSVPEEEYEETMLKARDFMEALGGEPFSGGEPF